MGWIIGIFVALCLLGLMLGAGKAKPKQLQRTIPACAPAASKGREYASIYENGEYRPLSSDEVAEMFSIIRDRIKEHRKISKAVQKLADKLAETGKLDEAAYAALSTAGADVSRTLAEAEALYDRLFFERETASDRYYKLIDDLNEIEADIESACVEIVGIKQDIKDGGFFPKK